MLTINQQSLSVDDVWSVAEGHAQVELGAAARSAIVKTRKAIEDAVGRGDVIYGVTTGFGAFKTTAIPQHDVAKLQENLIKSHAVGVGSPLPEPIVRGMMLIMVNYLSKGHSGIRPQTVDLLVNMLNNGVTPVVPEQGSVGSSGDLAPSAHVILVLLGLGEATVKGERMTGAAALKSAGLSPIKLEAKEGLALINNTACMTSIAAHTIVLAHRLIDAADRAGALSAEALRATDKAFDADVHAIKAHTGQVEVARHLLELLAGSTMLDTTRVQDQYSIRCMPQIHGAARLAVDFAASVVATELNSVTDNPLIFDTNGQVKVISAGNFHGEPVAIAMDTLCIALSELANVSDRRIASLLDGATNFGLPPFLATHGGLNSGFMILQYTTAALASENKSLAHPASVDSIPTSANVEDLVSMGTIAARQAAAIAKNTAAVLGIELMTAAQAVDFRLKDGHHLGKGTQAEYNRVRKVVPFYEQDEVYYPAIHAMTDYVLADKTS